MPVSVLVVEDDPLSSDILSQILEYNNMNVTVVSSAEDALQVLAHNRYDMAVLDLALPQMDGWQLRREMLVLPNAQGTIIVALTGFYTPLLAKKAKEAGFSAAFSKPVSVSLVAALEKLL